MYECGIYILVISNVDLAVTDDCASAKKEWVEREILTLGLVVAPILTVIAVSTHLT